MIRAGKGAGSGVVVWTLLVLMASWATCFGRLTDGPSENAAKTEDIEQSEAPEMPPMVMKDPQDLPYWEMAPRLPNYQPVDDLEAYLTDAGNSANFEDAFTTPLKRGRYNRLDILKRSRLNQLIHQLLQMKGESRYFIHRATPVRFAAGRR